MFDDSEAGASGSAAVLDRICAAARAENVAAGARLAAISELDVLRLAEHGECVDWAIDTTVAVTAEVAAALSIGAGLAGSYLHYARVMRTRLPRVGAALCAGEIGYLVFAAIAYRTDLITDQRVLAAVDAELAAKVVRWPSMTRSRMNACIDRVVVRRDPEAVRRRREAVADRELSIWQTGNGMAAMFGRLLAPDAIAVDARLDALAATVCDQDPRTRGQRRADAMAALAGGAQALACRCGRTDCAAAGTTESSPVVVYVVAEQASLDGASTTSAAVLGSDALIPAELLAELAATARLCPLTVPAVDAAPEPGYRPSKALADFVRCRDLTCRFPGCDEPATNCDLDHTKPFSEGGRTHASNMKCQCRTHHLVKTFWGWRDQQLPDGTVIWTAPSGHTYVTTPGSALLFPALCVPTGHLPAADTPAERCGERTAMMPRRRRTRAQNRADYVNTERRLNRKARQARQARLDTTHPTDHPTPRQPDHDPPPF